jgi:hypothetical protein
MIMIPTLFDHDDDSDCTPADVESGGGGGERS